ncbi:MAG: phosphatase PAP2 family protein [Oscillospiraceae bacterium]|nr:phosphatase PAP2 family protein [Oscillospiraceae bacterium]
MRHFFRRYRHWWYLLYLPVFIGLFIAAEHLVTDDYTVIHASLDDRIPFLEIFVVPYCLWYPFMAAAAAYLFFFESAPFKRYVTYLAICFTFSLAFCMLWPNGQDLRPETMPRDNVFTRIVEGLYRADTNTNVLPSIHVCGSIGVVLAVFDSRTLRDMRWPQPASVVLAVLIILSTMFIKQHSVWDVAAGFALSAAVWPIVYVWIKRRMDRADH